MEAQAEFAPGIGLHERVIRGHLPHRLQQSVQGRAYIQLGYQWARVGVVAVIAFQLCVLRGLIQVLSLA